MPPWASGGGPQGQPAAQADGTEVARPAASPLSAHIGGMIQRLRSSLERHIPGAPPPPYQAVEQVLEEVLRLPSASARLRHLTERLVHTKTVDFACVSLINNLSAFALLAIHGPGAEHFPPPISPVELHPTSLLSSSSSGSSSSATPRHATQATAQPRRSFSLFHSRRLFHLEGSGWSLQDVAASATPWYYDCSQQNVQGQPREAAWLHVAGLRSMVCLPCIHERRVCGAVLLASTNTRWDSKLLAKLQELVYHVTPFVVQAGVDLGSRLGALHAQRFKSSNEIAAGMVYEMVHLDKILLARITTSDSSKQTCARPEAPHEVTAAAPAAAAAAAAAASGPTHGSSCSVEARKPHAAPAEASAHVATQCGLPKPPLAPAPCRPVAVPTGQAVASGGVAQKQAYLQLVVKQLQQQQQQQQEQEQQAALAAAQVLPPAPDARTLVAGRARPSMGRARITAAVVGAEPEQQHPQQQQQQQLQQQVMAGGFGPGFGPADDVQSSTTSSRSSRGPPLPQDVVPVLLPPASTVSAGQVPFSASCLASQNVTPCGMLTGQGGLTGGLRPWEDEVHLSTYYHSLDASSCAARTAHTRFGSLEACGSARSALHTANLTPSSAAGSTPPLANLDAIAAALRVSDDGLLPVLNSPHGSGNAAVGGYDAGTAPLHGCLGSSVHGCTYDSVMHGCTHGSSVHSCTHDSSMHVGGRRSSAAHLWGLPEGQLAEELRSRLQGSAAYQAAEQLRMQQAHEQAHEDAAGREAALLQAEAAVLLLTDHQGLGCDHQVLGCDHLGLGCEVHSAAFLAGHDQGDMRGSAFMAGELGYADANSFMMDDHGLAGGVHLDMASFILANPTCELDTLQDCMRPETAGSKPHLGMVSARSPHSTTTMSCVGDAELLLQASYPHSVHERAGGGARRSLHAPQHGGSTSNLLYTQSTGRPSLHHQNNALLMSMLLDTPHSVRSSLHAPSAAAAAAAAAGGSVAGGGLGYNSSRFSLTSRGSMTHGVVAGVSTNGALGNDSCGSSHSSNIAGVCLANSSSLYSPSCWAGKGPAGAAAPGQHAVGPPAGLGGLSGVDRRCLPTLVEGTEAR